MYSTLVYSSVVYSIAAHRTEEGLKNIVYTCDTMVTKKTQSLPINFYDVLNAENGGRAKKNHHGGLDDIYATSQCAPLPYVVQETGQIAMQIYHCGFVGF